ncbi:hypothetical protein LNQ03_04185 [Klebsiella pneumoniae subsp. pneumoniae]|nr:hypothetical protein [Klebsiella pneumoniae subsp. pneumoniae]
MNSGGFLGAPTPLNNGVLESSGTSCSRRDGSCRRRHANSASDRAWLHSG